MSKMKRTRKTRPIRLNDLAPKRSPMGGKKATRKKATRTGSVYARDYVQLGGFDNHANL